MDVGELAVIINALVLLLVAFMAWDNGRETRARRRELAENKALTSATLEVAREILRQAKT